MNRFQFVLGFLLAGSVSYADCQTWDIGQNGQVTQTQSAKQSSKSQTSRADQFKGKGKKNGSANDDDLKQQVNQKFGTDAALRYVMVDVQNGDVTLSGTVPTRADRKRAAHLAKQVPGVHKVHDNLNIDANASSPTDNEPTNARNSAPSKPKPTASVRPRPTRKPAVGPNRATAPIHAGDTAVTGNGSETHLGANSNTTGGISGAVANAATATTPSSSGAAVASNASTAPNTKSQNEAELPNTVFGMRPLPNLATLKGQIENALRNDAVVGSSDVKVNVTDNLIELTGTVPTGKERTAAYRIAQSFAFNRHVEDRMTVTGRGRPGIPAIPDQKSAPASNTTPHSDSEAPVPKSQATVDSSAFQTPRV